MVAKEAIKEALSRNQPKPGGLEKEGIKLDRVSNPPSLSTIANYPGSSEATHCTCAEASKLLVARYFLASCSL
ncbi:hypothetical protein J6590_003807 [Homalodisca vitripennis]|nr:hypothetical protein J6590_003807 [Homalodisca vitripennis]